MFSLHTLSWFLIRHIVHSRYLICLNIEIELNWVWDEGETVIEDGEASFLDDEYMNCTS